MGGVVDRMGRVVDRSISKIAVLGTGHLGSVLVGAFAERLLKHPSGVYAFDRNESKWQRLVAHYGVSGTADLSAAVVGADVIVLAVKPAGTVELAAAVRAVLDAAQEKQNPLVVSVAAGVPIEAIKTELGPDYVLARAMPNLASAIGKGVTGLFVPGSTSDAKLLTIIFCSLGEVVLVDNEQLIDPLTALGGSAPAFIFTVIEALADGGVKMGLKREDALNVAAQVVYGAAALVKESGKHPEVLKDEVASPGGTTIAGLHKLELCGVRSAFASAIEASTERAREISAKFKSRQ